LEKYALIAVRSALGGLSRYIVGLLVMQAYGGRFPLGTLVVNVSGSFLYGPLMTLTVERLPLLPNLRLLLVIGFLGSYTTFSSFEYETFQALRNGGRLLAGLNVVASVIAGYLAVWTGVAVAGRR
jgi:fluoride exporter